MVLFRTNRFFLDDQTTYWNYEVLITNQEDEECANEEWFRNLSAALVGSGKRSFLEAISNGLGSGNSDLVTACLTTVAWLTDVLSSPTNAEFQLLTFGTLISRLKQILENGAQVENKVLASISLLNFSKISG